MAATFDVERLGPERYQGVEKQSTGYKLLASMGWKEGEGLGASKQGITEHVKVKKKHDALGVGAAENAQRLRDWTTGMVNYDRVLSGLKEITAASKPQQSSDDNGSEDSSSSSSSSDEDTSAKAKRQANKSKGSKKTASKASNDKANSPVSKGNDASVVKKKKKAPKEKEASPPSPSSSSGSEADAESSSSSENDSDSGSDSGTAAQKAAAAKLATHVGRYQKRERAKMVKGYSASDMAAILGAAPGGAPLAEVRAQPQASGSSSEEEAGSSSSSEGEDVPPKSAVARSKEAGGASADVVLEPVVEDPLAPKAWWQSLFIRAGRMGSTKTDIKSKAVAAKADGKKKIQITGFREEDQENLYEQVQHGAVHGRQGLGRADAPKKVAGAHWCGTKVKLDSDSEASSASIGPDSNDEVGASDSDDEAMAAGKIVILSSKTEQKDGKTRKQEVQMQPTAQAQTPQQQQQQAQQQQQQQQAQQNGAEPSSAKDKSKDKKKKKESGKKKGNDKQDGGSQEQQQVKSKSKTKQDKKKRKLDQESSDAVVETKSKKQKKASAPAPEQPTPAEGKSKKRKQQDGDTSNGNEIKWRKVVKKILEAAPERKLKLAKLRKRALQEAGVDVPKGSGVEDGEEGNGPVGKMMKKIRSCSDFQMEGGYVQLAC